MKQTQNHQSTMDIENVFHMIGGTEQNSYANNSSLQKNASDKVKHITLEAIQELYVTKRPKSLAIADLGCSTGPNTLSIIGDIIDTVHFMSLEMESQPLDFFQLFLNDLPGNDFNSVFKSLPEFLRERREKSTKLNLISSSNYDPMVFVGAFPGSFYGRLFPNDSIHFVYSASSVHWLSKVPPGIYDEQGKSINKGAVYICEKSPREVSKAYSEQFKEDFSSFLRLRSEEIISGGKMVLILSGNEGPDYAYRGNLFLWELLARAFYVLISKGMVEEEKLDSYDVHFHAPSKEELENEVKREGSFKLDKFEAFENKREERKKGDDMNHGRKIAMAVRAIQASMLSQHFGEEILDSLFEIYGTLIDEEMDILEIRPVSFVLVLRRN